MYSKNITINWSDDAKEGLKGIYHYLLQRNSVSTSRRILREIILSPINITFPEQFQFDEFRENCRRIIVRNYKVFYIHQDNIINIITVIDSRRNP